MSTQAAGPSFDRESALARLQAIKREQRRRKSALDPAFWLANRMGEHAWSLQARIMRSVRDHRKTAVPSCHEAGKSFIAARTIAWWLDPDVHPAGSARAVTSATTGSQVKAVLWHEINRAHAKGGLAGRTNQTEWWLPVLHPNGAINEEMVAFGRKPADLDFSGFQGVHAERVLVVFDEASGIHRALWNGADSLIANDDSRFLAIGNPDDPDGKFAEICQPGSGWNVIPISAFDTPNFTGEEIPAPIRKVLVGYQWIEEKRKEWAANWHWNEEKTEVLPPKVKKGEEAAPNCHPFWESKVLGRFSSVKEGGLIPISWIRAAQERDLSSKIGNGPNELGADVGGGGDSSTIAHRRGPVVRIISEDHNPDTMQTAGKVAAARKQTKATKVKIDEIGIGRGVVDRGKELGLPFVGINVSETPDDSESFVNRRAENWWNVRERFETGNIDIDENDHALLAELVSLRFKRTSSGKIQIESKEEAMRRGVKSPNRADALMLAFAEVKPPPVARTVDVSWG